MFSNRTTGTNNYVLTKDEMAKSIEEIIVIPNKAASGFYAFKNKEIFKVTRKDYRK